MNCFLFQFILFFSFLFQIKASKIITKEYSSKKNYIPNVLFELVEFNMDYKNWVNTFLPFSLFKDGNIENKFPIVSTRKVKFYKEYTCNEYKMTIRLDENNVVSNYSVIHASTFFIPDQGWSFSYQVEDESFNLVYLLYKNKLIDNKIFAFHPKSSESKGKFYLGGLPKIDNLFTGVINVDKSYPTWGTTIKEVRYNNETYKLDKYAAFHTGFFNLLSSNYFFDLVILQILKSEYNSGKCNQTEVDKDYHEYGLICYKEIYDNLQPLEMVFNDITVTIKKENLFTKSDENLYSSKFITNPYEHYNFTIIGFEFIELFNYTAFNYEDSTSTFYTNQAIITNNNNFVQFCKLIKPISITIMLICLANIGILFVFFLKNTGQDRYLLI